MGGTFAATIIADASHDYQTKSGGYGYCISSNKGRLTGGAGMRSLVQDSTIAEMMALVNTLCIAINASIVVTSDRVLMQTDCLGAIDGLEEKRKAREGQEREVVSFFVELKMKYDLRIEFRHVKGHTRTAGARYETNRLCDARAGQAMRELRRLRLAKPHIDQIEGILRD